MSMTFTRRTLNRGLIALGLPSCATGSGGPPAGSRTGERVGGVEVGQPAPALSLRGLDRKSTSLQRLRGQVVVLDIWASWCEPCKIELPALDDIAQRLSAKNVIVAAVSIDQEAANVQRFLNTRRHWTVKFFHDPSGDIAERLAPPKMPTSYVIDRRGVVRMVNAGFQPSDAARIERQLRELLA